MLSSRVSSYRVARSRRRCEQASRLHGTGLPRAGRRHTDDAEQQGRLQEVAQASSCSVFPPRRGMSHRKPTASACCMPRSPGSFAPSMSRPRHHFFDDLGANSLLMARVCAAIRKNPGMSNVSMRDIYMHPTIARLAHHLDSSIDSSVATKPEPFHVPSTLSYVTCGVLQIGFVAPICCSDSGSLWTGFNGRPPPTAWWSSTCAASPSAQDCLLR